MWIHVEATNESRGVEVMELEVKDFWATQWDRHGDEKLPVMFTVWYKGTPIADTKTPLKWIRDVVNAQCFSLKESNND